MGKTWWLLWGFEIIVDFVFLAVFICEFVVGAFLDIFILNPVFQEARSKYPVVFNIVFFTNISININNPHNLYIART